MSFSYTFNFGFLSQTSVYNHNAEASPAAGLSTTHTSPNIKVTLYPRWYKHIVIEWSIPEDWGQCFFNVYFAETEDGSFKKLNPSPISGNYLSDAETQEYKKFNRGFYVVEALLVDKAMTPIRSISTTWDASQNRWVQLRSNEIQRREYLLLSKFTGIKTYLFRRKNYGSRCPECWGKVIEKSVKDKCKTCLGTTFVGGYFPAVATFMQYDPTAQANNKTYVGVVEDNQITAWTIAFPEMHPDDIIVRVGDWNLYRVDRMGNTELQANKVRQIAVLTQLSKTNIEYELLTKGLVEFPVEYR